MDFPVPFVPEIMVTGREKDAVKSWNLLKRLILRDSISSFTGMTLPLFDQDRQSVWKKDYFIRFARPTDAVGNWQQVGCMIRIQFSYKRGVVVRQDPRTI